MIGLHDPRLGRAHCALIAVEQGKGQADAENGADVARSAEVANSRLHIQVGNAGGLGQSPRSLSAGKLGGPAG